MKLSDGLEWTLHCCTVLGSLPPDVALPAGRLAEFHAVPPAYLAKQLQALSRAGVVETAPGRRGGSRLARPATEITLLDVVVAVEGEAPAFRCTEIRQQGPSAVGPEHYVEPCGIARAMWRAETAWRDELRNVTIGDLVAELDTSVSPEQQQRAVNWVIGVLS